LNKFTYFDFIAYIVPGALLLAAISSLTRSSDLILITGNTAIDTLLFLIIGFIIGALSHQLSRYSIEPLVRRLFWHGRFYSDIYLVKRYQLCEEPLRDHIIDTAKSFFHFDSTSLSALDSDEITGKFPDPHVVSHQLFRQFDYYTMDNDLAKKGHVANAFYSLYRSMTLMTFILAILFVISLLWDASSIESSYKVVLAVLSFLASIAFLFRTRNEGQAYVQGVLSSLSKVSSSTATTG